MAWTALAVLTLVESGCPSDQDFGSDWHCGASCKPKNPAVCEETIGVGISPSQQTAKADAESAAMRRAKSSCEYSGCTFDCRSATR